MITVRPSLIASREFLICSVAMASRLAVGSSRKIIGDLSKIILRWQFFAADHLKAVLHHVYSHQEDP